MWCFVCLLLLFFFEWLLFYADLPSSFFKEIYGIGSYVFLSRASYHVRFDENLGIRMAFNALRLRFCGVLTCI